MVLRGWVVVLALNLWHFALLATLDTWGNRDFGDEPYEIAVLALIGSVVAAPFVIGALVDRTERS